MSLFPNRPVPPLKWLIFALTGAVLILPAPAQAEQQACVATGHWQSPRDGSTIKQSKLLDDMAKRPIVLLGEAHTSGEHHRWQLHTLAALYGRNPNMVIGFEAFPRAVQPILDRWIRGELSEKKFIDLSRWNDTWRYDPSLYMPLFHFARMHRIPMRALNVERALIRAVSQDGWAAIDGARREGVGDPKAPSKAYRESLTKVFAMHGEHEAEKQPAPALSKADAERLAHFIEVQTIWDRAMAEALAQVRTAGGKPLVVAIVGRGHVEYGFGIPHQLADLGIDDAAVLLPWDKGQACDLLKTADDLVIAEAVFGVDEPADSVKPAPPMLGVQIESTDKGVRVIKVVSGSVAAAAGLKVGDIITDAGAVKMTKTMELVSTIHAISPGSWLPLVILRDGKALDVIAKFPHQPHQP